MALEKRKSDDVPTEGTVDFRSPGVRIVAAWNGGALARDVRQGTSIVIGRGSEADLCVDHASVSRRHAQISVGADIRVEDLGSSNGTFVAGRRIEPRTAALVQPGTLIELGSVMVSVQSGTARTARSFASPSVVVADPEMVRLYELLEVIAKSSLPVIFLGETGAGKEVLAMRLHELSPRSAAPLCKVNCGALVETLLEAELFGYERGAFTGAVQAKPGLIESAMGGTLFLDELGEMPLTTQVKLLRVLESREVTRVGGLKPRPIDVRFVAATNRDLRELIATGRFRQDLFFRLDGVSVRVPPLRERTSEIATLAVALLEEACVAAGRAPCRFSDDAMAALLHHPWTGNVRELKNVVNRSALLSVGPVISAADLRFEALGSPSIPPAPPWTPSSPAPSLPSPADDEARAIGAALEECAGNQTKAAKRLGISRRTLIKRLDELGLPRPRKERV